MYLNGEIKEDNWLTPPMQRPSVKAHTEAGNNGGLRCEWEVLDSTLLMEIIGWMQYVRSSRTEHR